MVIDVDKSKETQTQTKNSLGESTFIREELSQEMLC